MNIILLSGGSGKRLWPLSNEVRAKQFLKLLPNQENALESMIQRVYRQIHEADLNAQVLIATGLTQGEQIANHLGNKVELVIEPERRNTFTAILLSCQYLLLKKGYSENDIVLVLPVDPYTDLSYFHMLKSMEEIVQQGKSEIVLMGITPTYPSTEYGYIVPHLNNSQAHVYEVARFEEKPSEANAQMLIQQGGLWNAGVFAFKLGFIKALADHYLEGCQTYEDIFNQYANLPETSFDYEVLEKTSSISMIHYDGVWKDLGTWNSLTEAMKTTAYGNVIFAEDNHGTHVINELDIPILVTGAENMVVVASPDGILVSSKDSSTHIKSYVDKINMRSMYEEKRWGYYKILNHFQHSDGSQTLIKRLTVNAGFSISYQSHQLRSEVWTVIEGCGSLVLNGAKGDIKRGDVVNIRDNIKHTVHAIDKLTIIEVQMGTELLETDIEKWEWVW